MHYLTILDSHRDEWRKYLLKMGAQSNIDDIIQDSYLRVDYYKLENKIIKDGGKVNKTYFWCVLHTVWLNSVKVDNRMRYVQIDELVNTIPTDKENNLFEGASESVFKKLYNEIDKLDNEGEYPYNKEMLMLYVNSGLSMRGIRDKTTIGLSSIYNTISKCRKQIEKAIGEDFNNLITKNYEEIT